MLLSLDKIQILLRGYGYDVLTVTTGLIADSRNKPMITFDHQSYPGVEAHLFTAANSAFWIPKFDENRNVVVSYPHSNSVEESGLAWDRLLGCMTKLGSLLHIYRNHILAGNIPTVIWAHHDAEWFRELRNAPFHEKQDTSNFINYVDPSIRTHITILNDYGFDTLESCSGLPQDHLDRDPYRPYVMLDERAYHGCIPHFFTLADIADWIPSYSPHNFDVYIRMRSHQPIENAWSKLVQSAKKLGMILYSYQQMARRTPSDLEELDMRQKFPGKSLVTR